jgi:hypothetical protein
MQMTAEDASMTMSADMPCCPEQKSMPDCGKDCPFMAACTMQTLSGLSQVPALIVPLSRTSTIRPTSDSDVSLLAYAPPPRPPKA